MVKSSLVTKESKKSGGPQQFLNSTGIGGGGKKELMPAHQESQWGANLKKGGTRGRKQILTERGWGDQVSVTNRSKLVVVKKQSMAGTARGKKGGAPYHRPGVEKAKNSKGEISKGKKRRGSRKGGGGGGGNTAKSL